MNDKKIQLIVEWIVAIIGGALAAVAVAVLF